MFQKNKQFLLHCCLWDTEIIYTDNVHILCLSSKVKKSKTTANLPENIRNKRHSNRLPWCQLSRWHLYWYSFFSLLNMNQVPETLYFGEWSYATKIIQSVQYACLNRSSAGWQPVFHAVKYNVYFTMASQFRIFNYIIVRLFVKKIRSLECKCSYIMITTNAHIIFGSRACLSFDFVNSL